MEPSSDLNFNPASKLVNVSLRGSVDIVPLLSSITLSRIGTFSTFPTFTKTLACSPTLPTTGIALNIDIALPISYITPALNCIAVIGSASNFGLPERKKFWCV